MCFNTSADKWAFCVPLALSITIPGPPTGMQQQIAQLAGNAMIDNLFGDKIPPSLAGALSVNLVIDVYGECNTRVDGDLRARRMAAREFFVPGGASEGGVLPPNLADSLEGQATEADFDTGLTAALAVSREKEVQYSA